MRVKNYRAKTVSEATALVKSDLGSDALIISTRKLGSADGGNLVEI